MELTLKPNSLVILIITFIVSLITFTIMSFFIAGNIVTVYWQISLILLIIVSSISAFIAYMNATHTTYKFNDNNINYYEGFMTIKKKVIEYNRITDINFVQNFPIDTIFGTGTIILMTAGGQSGGISLKNIDNPENAYNEIKKILDKSKTHTSNMSISDQHTINMHVQSEDLKDITAIKPLAFVETIKKSTVISFYFLAFILFVTFMVLISFFEPGLNASQNWYYITLIYLIPVLIYLSIVFLIYKNNKAKSYSFLKDTIEYNEGFLTKRKITVSYSKITDISFTQGWFLDRLFSVGSIYIATAGSRIDQEIVMSSIPNTEDVYNKIKYKTTLKTRNEY